MNKYLPQITSLIILSALVLPTFISAEPNYSEERQVLEEELRVLEEQIAQYNKEIQTTGEEKKTLQNKIYILKNKIKKLDIQIYQSNVVINDLGFQIEDTELSIQKTSLKIEESKERIAVILRNIHEEDQRPLIGILISEGLSEFFDNLAALEALNIENKKLLTDIKSLKVYLEDQKNNLDEEKDDLSKQVVIQTLQRQNSAEAKVEQDRLLMLTEAEYQKYLKEKSGVEKKAREIRSRIFELIGVPEAPTFGEAYEIAKFVSVQTGIRPSLLLAVLTQESNIGKNVGQCYLKNPSTGDGIVVYTGKDVSRVMKPMNLSGRKGDVEAFLSITKELGRDPYNTPISCPMSIGWGGAMGPSQFIPSTWIMYKDKIAKITGTPPDPWNIKDAFLATGVYLKDLGALQDEFKAVMRYFSGYDWSKWEEFYGRSVLNIAANYEEDIKELEK